MKNEAKVVLNGFGATPTLTIHSDVAPDPIATMAFAMIERWGMVAGQLDGEDTAGRARLTVMPVEALVTRAFDAAELAFKLAAEKGHLVPLPSWEEMRLEAEEQRRRN